MVCSCIDRVSSLRLVCLPYASCVFPTPYRVSTKSSSIHLVTHAVLKATLFMALGLLLHSTSVQDSRAIPTFYAAEGFTSLGYCSCIRSSHFVYPKFHRIPPSYSLLWSGVPEVPPVCIGSTRCRPRVLTSHTCVLSSSRAPHRFHLDSHSTP